MLTDESVGAGDIARDDDTNEDDDDDDNDDDEGDDETKDEGDDSGDGRVAFRFVVPDAGRQHGGKSSIFIVVQLIFSK